MINQILACHKPRRFHSGLQIVKIYHQDLFQKSAKSLQAFRCFLCLCTLIRQAVNQETDYVILVFCD
ncbi:MAG: hypothetical protein DRH10_06280 [Deltaproteobacteria bacterium]|nr:MAG: hypothetical protein DRH10_06280 [Deltaproteobacteria bacterium]